MTTSHDRPEHREERHPDRVTWWDTTWRIGAAFLLGATFWLFTVAMVYPEGGDQPQGWRGPWLIFVDPALGVLTAGLLVLRRRWPVTITTVATLLTCGSTVAAGPQTLILTSLATRQRWREIVPMTVLTTIMGLIATRFLYPEPEPLPLWVEALLNVLIVAVIVAVGYSIGSRRALVRSWVDRARTAEAEQRARVASAQTTERTRIAREMHDVLAHRISLVTMHSGILAYRQDLPEEERLEVITAIDTNARAALTDLREVLGVLRDPDGTGSLRPQSTLTDVEELVDDATAAGARVVLETDDLDLAAVPETTGRTAYRAVQEGLTNARKHAPGTTVVVTLAGAPGDGLHVAVTNPRAVGTDIPSVPASGLGLLGLAERVEIAGGRLEHGWRPEGEGRHHLEVWLPWAP